MSLLYKHFPYCLKVEMVMSRAGCHCDTDAGVSYTVAVMGTIVYNPKIILYLVGLGSSDWDLVWNILHISIIVRPKSGPPLQSLCGTFDLDTMLEKPHVATELTGRCSRGVNGSHPLLATGKSAAFKALLRRLHYFHLLWTVCNPMLLLSYEQTWTCPIVTGKPITLSCGCAQSGYECTFFPVKHLD